MLGHDLDMVSVLSIDRLMVVVRCMVPGGVVRHFMVDAVVGIAVVGIAVIGIAMVGFTVVGVAVIGVAVILSDIVDWHLPVVSLSSVLVVVVM